MDSEPTITEAQALQQVEEIIRSTAAQLKPKPRLTRLPQPELDRGKCTDPTDGGSEERVQVGRAYWLDGIPEDRNGEIAEQVKTFWESEGYEITEATGIEKNQPGVLARKLPEDFRMSVQWSTDGSISLGVSSPCIWPKGTPEPFKD